MKSIPNTAGSVASRGFEPFKSAWLAGCILTLGLGADWLWSAAPPLEVTRQTNLVLLRWNTNLSSFRLEQTPTLPGAWTTVPGTPQVRGDRFETGLEMTNQTRFFRLRQSLGPAVIGLVQNSRSEPVANAILGALQLTGADGIFSGPINASTSGWAMVEAPGYAINYVKATVRRDQTDLTETWLTPWASQAEVSSTNPTVRLHLGSAESPTCDVTVSANDFTNSPVQVALAEIHPLDAGPLFARLSPKENRHLSQAFALQAFDVLSRPVELAPGRQLPIQILDSGGTNPPPRLAWFNPAVGVWQTVSNGCQRIGSNRLACVVTRLTALHGLFEVGAAPYLAAASAAGQWPVSPQTAPAQSPPSESDYDAVYKRDRGRVGDRLNTIADILEGGGQIDPMQDAELLDALGDMARHAQDYANAHPNESAKTKLLVVAEHATLLGQTALAQTLMNQATEIANQLARQLLAEGDCGRVREMLHVMEQLMLMAGDQSLIDALREKIDRLFAECDLWIGTVRFVSFTDGHHPGIEELSLQSGLFSWSELHDIKMATHAQTLALKGEDSLTLSFPRVKFQAMDNECEFSISFYGQPASAANFLNFDGTYDGVAFSVGPLSPAAGAQPVSVTQYQVIQVPDADDNCVHAPGTPVEYPFPNYYSVLMHGFLDTPPLTLQEMLDTGTRSTGPFGDVISGYEKVSNAYPAPNYGRYPFTSGLITWRFIHVKKLLPLGTARGPRSN